MSWGTITIKGKRKAKGNRPADPPIRYTITDEDILWGARMCWYENYKDSPLVIWSMTMRYMHLLRANFKKYSRLYPTLASLFRAYSQPINPWWRRDGKKCKPGASHHKKEACAEHRLKRRDTAKQISIQGLLKLRGGDRAVGTVMKWASGRLPMPDGMNGAIHFAHSKVVKAKVRGGQINPDWITVKGENWFHVVNNTKNWPSDMVTISAKNGVNATGKRLKILVTLGVFIAAVLAGATLA